MLEGKKVLPTKILVKKDLKEEAVTKSGIIVPNVVEESTCSGMVVLAGEGTPSMPMSIQVGHHILFPPRAVQKVVAEDQTYWLVSATDVLLYW